MQVIEDALADKPHCGRALEKLFVPLLATLPFKAQSPRHTLATLVEFAEQQTDEVLDEALRLLTTPSSKAYCSHDVRRRNIERAIGDARRIVDGAEKRNRPATPEQLASADPDVVAKGALVRDALKARLGKDVFDGWFAAIEFERFEGGIVTASVGLGFQKRWIQQHLAIDLDACTRAVFPGATSINLIARDGGRS